MAMDYFSMYKANEKASENPLMVMADEESGSRYARAVGQKGLVDGQEMSRLIEDMCAQLRAWGHAGGAGGELIVKSDGEPACERRSDEALRGEGDAKTTRQRRKGGERVGGRSGEDGQGIRMYFHLAN